MNVASPTQDSSENSTNIDHHHQSLPGEKTTRISPEIYDDLPPESFWVSKNDERDWFVRNAIIERKSSRKLSFSLNTTHRKTPPRRSSFSFSNHKTAKASSIIGLPIAQKSVFPDGNHRQNKPGIMYFFRSLSAPGGKLTMQLTEPVSPQVSCLGRVGTKREKGKTTSLWGSIAAILRTRWKATAMASSKESAGSVAPDTQTPTLANLKQLRSGRRSDQSHKSRVG